MEKGNYSIRDIRALILNEFYEKGYHYYCDRDTYGNYIEIEFLINSKNVDYWIVHVIRFYTEYNNEITNLNDMDYLFTITKDDFKNISRRSRFL